MKIGDKFYRVSIMARCKVYDYTITSIAERIDGYTYYDVECSQCRHGIEHCKIEILDNGVGFHFSKMLNGNVGWEDWHKGSPYHTSIQNAWIWHYEQEIAELKRVFNAHKESIELCEQDITEAHAKLEEWRSKNDA